MFYLVSLVREAQGYTVISDYPVEEEIDTQNLAYLQENFPHIKKDNLWSIHQSIYNQHNMKLIPLFSQLLHLFPFVNIIGFYRNATRRGDPDGFTHARFRACAKLSGNRHIEGRKVIA